MSEERVRHRHWIEKAETIGKYLRPLLGLLFAITITVLCLAAGIVSVLSGHGIAATVFFGLTLLGILSKFIKGTSDR